MEQKLTSEEIARVFAMYWGCHIRQDIGNTGVDGKLIRLSQTTACIEFDSYKTSAWEYSGCKLLLTPLSKITDEHKRIIAEMVYPNSTSDLDYIGYGIVTSPVVLPANVHQQLIDWGYVVILYPWGKTAIELNIAIEKV